MDKFNEIKVLMAEMEKDADKFFNRNNAAAGVSLRNGMQALKHLAQEVRVAVTEKKNS